MTKCPSENAGRIIQERSTNRMKTTRAAASESVRGFRFARRDRSRRNGRTNWRKRTASPTYPQPPRKRARYHEISSGRLPDQMMRYCEKVTYAQNMVKA